MATDNHEEIRAWGWLLSELKSIAQREGVEVTLDDEDLYITAPRAGYPLIMRKLLSAAAIKPEDDAVIRAIADNTEPGEDYGTTYQRLTLEDQGALMLESMRFDSNMISVEDAAVRLSASEQQHPVVAKGWKDSRAKNPRRAVHLRFVNSEDSVNS